MSSEQWRGGRGSLNSGEEGECLLNSGEVQTVAGSHALQQHNFFAEEVFLHFFRLSFSLV